MASTMPTVPTEETAVFHQPAGLIRVLLADDHPALRMGLHVLLDQASDIQVLDEARDGAEALTKIDALAPDVIVLDCQLPGISGPEVAAEIRRRGLATRVLALSAYRDERFVRGMIGAGAVGYLLKEEAPGVIVAAVRATSKGESWYSQAVAVQVVAWKREDPSIRTELTERECQVLRMVARGWKNRRIAKELAIGERTVAFHVENLMEKLGAQSRTEAATEAIRRGWLETER